MFQLNAYSSYTAVPCKEKKTMDMDGKTYRLVIDALTTTR